MAAVGWSGYLGVLRVPGALAFSGSAAIARLAQAMLGLGSVVMLTQVGRSFAVAGLVAGSISVAQGAVGPQVSRLVDRRGQRAVVVPQLAVLAAAVACLVWSGLAGSPTWLLVVVALIVGASLPQMGAQARARWTTLLEGGPQLERALAVESLIEEAVFVVGPVMVTALATAVTPAAGLLTALGLAVVGGGLFLAQRCTEPLPGAAETVTAGRAGRDGALVRRDSALASARLLVLVATFTAIGALFGFSRRPLPAARRAGRSGHDARPVGRGQPRRRHRLRRQDVAGERGAPISGERGRDGGRCRPDRRGRRDRVAAHDHSGADRRRVGERTDTDYGQHARPACRADPQSDRGLHLARRERLRRYRSRFRYRRRPDRQ